MKEIGGYFELELQKGCEYHNNTIKLNSGRNCFKYILKAQSIKKAYVPVFVCDSILEPLEELDIAYEFYNIDEKFEIMQNIMLEENEKLLYVNYFALKSKYIETLIHKYGNKLVIDNTQAFFEHAIEKVDTIYSPRKFFGVSDGGYLNTNHFLNEELKVDESYKYTKQLIGRCDKNASDFYNSYQHAEQRLMNQPIKQMSNFTSKVLASINYENVMIIRKQNFEFLHRELESLNLLNYINVETVPFSYPLMIDDSKLKERLIHKKIYIATYWKEALNRVALNKHEKKFVKQIISIPIDQRYDLKDMESIIKIIKGTKCST